MTLRTNFIRANLGGVRLALAQAFSSFQYDGNTTSGVTINTGQDLVNNKFLAMFTKRNGSSGGVGFIDSLRGINKINNSIASKSVTMATPPVATTTGMTIPAACDSAFVNGANTFEYNVNIFVETERFFKMCKVNVTRSGTAWTGGAKTIPHGLKISPGMIIFYCEDTVNNSTRYVWHKDTGNSSLFVLGENGVKLNYGSPVISVDATNIYLNDAAYFISPTGTYDIIFYVFGHDTSSDSYIRCGSYTPNSNTTDYKTVVFNGSGSIQLPKNIVRADLYGYGAAGTSSAAGANATASFNGSNLTWNGNPAGNTNTPPITLQSFNIAEDCTNFTLSYNSPSGTYLRVDYCLPTSVDFGLEPQFFMIRPTTTSETMRAYDNDRVLNYLFGSDSLSFATGAETREMREFLPDSPTGIKMADMSYSNIPNNVFIWMAIAKNKITPTSGQDVYYNYRTDDYTSAVSLPFKPEVYMRSLDAANTGYGRFQTMVKGGNKRVAKTSYTTTISLANTHNLRFDIGSKFKQGYANDSPFTAHVFRSAPGFMDVRFWLETDLLANPKHALGKNPEFIMNNPICTTGYGELIYHRDLGLTRFLTGGSISSYGLSNSGNGNVPPSKNSFYFADELTPSLMWRSILFSCLRNVSKVGFYTSNIANRLNNTIDYSAATWTKNLVSVSQGSYTDRFGYQRANKLIASASTGVHSLQGRIDYKAFSGATIVALVAVVAPAGYNFVALTVGSPLPTVKIIVDLTTGDYTTSGTITNCRFYVTKLTNGYFKIVVHSVYSSTLAAGSSSTGFTLSVCQDATVQDNFTGDGVSGILFDELQWEIHQSGEALDAYDLISTTDSKDFSSTGWVKTNSYAKITANSATDSDGTVLADTLGIASADTFTSQGIGVTYSTSDSYGSMPYRLFSVHAKAGGFDSIELSLKYEDGWFGAVFNLTDGTISAPVSPNVLSCADMSSCTKKANGYFECGIAPRIVAMSFYNYEVRISLVKNGSTLINSDGSNSGVFLYKAKFIEGVYHTVLEPTGDVSTGDKYVDCGFTSPARFVLIAPYKSNTSNPGYYIFNNADGIVSGTDVLDKPGSTAAKLSGNYINPYSKGFSLPNNATTWNKDEDNRVYLYLAVS